MNQLLPNPYLLGAGIALMSYILMYGARKLLSTRLGSTKWNIIVAHTVEHTTKTFMVCASMYIALEYIPNTRRVQYYADRGFFLMTMVQVAIWANYLIDQWVMATFHRKTRRNRAAAGSLSFFKLFCKFVFFCVIFLFTLNNLNIRVTTILAGFGVGGIAVALAMQKILGDLFSSLSILLDKPFVVGDFIIIDTFLGEVEKIGLRTTHIRSLSGEQLIFSNSDLVAARIKNYKRMAERRVTFILSLTLETSPDHLERAVTLASQIIKGKERVRFDRVHLFQISKNSMDVEIVYYVLSDDYNVHMDIQQMILLEIYRAYADNNIHFAYPYQVLHQGPPAFWKDGMGKENSFPMPGQRS